VAKGHRPHAKIKRIENLSLKIIYSQNANNKLKRKGTKLLGSYSPKVKVHISWTRWTSWFAWPINLRNHKELWSFDIAIREKVFWFDMTLMSAKYTEVEVLPSSEHRLMANFNHVKSFTFTRVPIRACHYCWYGTNQLKRTQWPNRMNFTRFWDLQWQNV
jgi:hypothetical protein